MAARVFRFLLVAAVVIVIGPRTPARASHPIPAPTVVQQNLTIPWDLDFAPDGTMFVTERVGRISVFASGQPGAARLGQPTVVPNVRSEHESGLNGIAVDVDFSTHPYIYVCASRDVDGAGSPMPWVNEVLRYEVTPQRALVDGEVIFTGGLAAFQHNGCSLEMDAAGMLWVGIGDGAVQSRAQDPESLNGKILRINRDGSIPADNPIWSEGAQPTAVYSMGHRNPQGIAFEPGTGQVWASEHGPSVDDEINRIVAGGNYGWPCYTGAGRPFNVTEDCGLPTDYANPAWSSGGPTIATSGMTFLDHPLWEEWAGSPVVSQLKEQDLRRFTLSNGGATMTQADLMLDGQFGRLRAAVLAPDGALYATTSNGTNDRVIRIVPGPVVVDRFDGADRYATAAAISAGTFPAGVPVVYVATGRNFPDALAGGPAAARDRGPVLLVNGGIPAVTIAELQRLQPQRIVVLGGTSAISQAVQNQLAAYAPGGVTRLSGADRFATAAAISRATFAPGVPVAYVSTGLGFPDALAGGAAAGVEGGPIVLVNPGGVPAATALELDRLNPQRIVVLGGAEAVSVQVANSLQQYTPAGIVRRSGADRYATAVSVSQGSFPGRAAHVLVATGLNFPDGLAGGPAAALRRGPLLLVPGSSLPSSVGAELARLDPDRVTVLGGTSVITADVQAQIDALLNP